MNTSLLSTRQAAAYLNLSAATLNVWRCTGRGPAFVRLVGTVRYPLADLQAFIDQGRVGAAVSA